MKIGKQELQDILECIEVFACEISPCQRAERASGNLAQAIENAVESVLNQKLEHKMKNPLATIATAFRRVSLAFKKASKHL